jgi:hypothetical protein
MAGFKSSEPIERRVALCAALMVVVLNHDACTFCAHIILVDKTSMSSDVK